MQRPFFLEHKSYRNQTVSHLLAGCGHLLSPFSYRAFAGVAKLLGKAAAQDCFCTSYILPDAKFRFRLSDFYWNRLVSSAFEYEPEISFLLRQVRDIPYVFLDCGANYGYWSLIASSECFGRHPVVAVEACRETFDILEESRKRNGQRFVALHRAIAAASNQSVPIYTRGSHAGASLLTQWLGNYKPVSKIESVETISIDDLVDQFAQEKTSPIVIKLDVEGMEVEALKGSIRTVARQPLIIYEEYGEDLSCQTSEFVMSELNMDVFFVDDNQQVAKIDSVNGVRKLKIHKTRGYNFLAATAQSPFWKKLIMLRNRVEIPGRL